MQHDQFIGRVQAAARLPSRGDAERTTRVVLEHLGERLAGGLPDSLAAQLPPEIARHLGALAGESQRFSPDDLFQAVSVEEGSDLPDAVFHTRAVLGVLAEAISSGQLDKVLDQLPDDFAPLFAGGDGKLER